MKSAASIQQAHVCPLVWSKLKLFLVRSDQLGDVTANVIATGIFAGWAWVLRGLDGMAVRS